MLIVVQMLPDYVVLINAVSVIFYLHVSIQLATTQKYDVFIIQNRAVRVAFHLCLYTFYQTCNAIGIPRSLLEIFSSTK